MGRIGMSQKELRRVEVLARVKRRDLKVVDAASLVEVSYRQAKRLWKRYREEGAAGLQHRSAGRSLNHSHDEMSRQREMRWMGVKYRGEAGDLFGPTRAVENVDSEDWLKVHAETLRRWMLAEGLWRRERKRRRHLLRRERKEHFGEMVQMDGSFHAWLEERGPQGCLIDLVDDATSTTWARLGEQETIWAVVDALRAWIERYGVPQSVYVDWKNLYKRPATVKEQLRGEEPVTQFGRMCAKLGIEVIAASSPQAKGRVERQHGTHQDRLVKKLRRKQIASHEAANVYLERDYLPEHNGRFARAAAKAEDYHRGAPRAAELDRIFCLEKERTISNDGVVRYQNRWFQLVAQSRPRASAQDRVLVCEGRHGNIAIEYRGRTLRWQEIPAPRPPMEIESQPAVNPGTQPKPPRVQRKWVPPSNHPWREAARRGEQQRARKLAAMAARASLAWPSASP